ncbi:MutS-related protein [Pseudobacter ginsenosidimutans]|uniref:MutS-like protein n=1 Tax=Pseudobacter ginsenosidimutans TaxID=661488 RepID=A0A4Q7MNN5_9BACT|nr:DNA mismatch repair protein [Pseudobacter ginsenosidimutans]QEC45752.1 DNA mismatch repair protein [Pseudobacter ginsenosidimutans]RZS69303.1 MutS-like protein [Pseudobacter ginsenosidimutans]
MSFTVDKQTLDDLNVLGKYKGNSIYNLFDRTQTRGGAQVLENLFQHPLTDADAINQRTAILKFFQQGRFTFPVQKELCEEVEQYLSMAGAISLAGAAMNMLRSKAMRIIASDKEHELITRGILSTVKLIRETDRFMQQVAVCGDASFYQKTIDEIKRICNTPGINQALAGVDNAIKGFGQQVKMDHQLRHSSRQDLEKLLSILYEADAFISVTSVAEERKFGYALALPFKEGENRIAMENLFHPQVPGAVPNSVGMNVIRNLVFLTGANMAGKSTFMKSFGVALYLAHMGFPVAAEAMEFSIQDGIYTSINVPDNLNEGYSHFYAEVLRVKRVAEEVSRGRNLVIIFDELFKGTNVKDAYDATVAVTEAFGENRNCTFIVSTHIVEAGETLRHRSSNMQFLFFPTIMEKQVPRYTYQLQEGISADRHGMMIIANEGIVDIIKAKKVSPEGIFG